MNHLAFALPEPKRPVDATLVDVKFTKTSKSGRRLLDSISLAGASLANFRDVADFWNEEEKGGQKKKTPRGSLAVSVGMSKADDNEVAEASEELALLSHGKPQLPPCVRSAWRPRLAPVKRPAQLQETNQTSTSEDSPKRTVVLPREASKSILSGGRGRKTRAGAAKNIFESMGHVKSRPIRTSSAALQPNSFDRESAASADSLACTSPKGNSELVGIIRKSVAGGGRSVTARATILNQGEAASPHRATQVMIPGQEDSVSLSRENRASRIGEPRMLRPSRAGDIGTARLRRSQMTVLEDEDEDGVGFPMGGGRVGSSIVSFGPRTSEDIEESEDTGSPRGEYGEGHAKNSDFQRSGGSSPKERSKVLERLKRLDVKRVQKLRQDRHIKQRELKFMRFNELPESEAEAIRGAFQLFDMDNSGYLDQREVVLCLQEFGMRGTTSVEKREIMRICREATSALVAEPDPDGDRDPNDIAVDLLEFALTVVPQVRRRLVELRGDNMLKEFFKFDTDGSGKLSKREIKELARGMGIDPQMIERETEWMKGDDEVDFDTFQEMICKGYEQLNRAIRERERHVQLTMGLDESVFLDFRGDLVSLFDTFKKFDADGSCTLSKTEIMPMLKEFGLMPQNQTEKEDVQKILTACDADDSSEFTFPEFLECVREIRKYKQSKERARHIQLFERYDRDDSGYLNSAELSKLIEDLGLCPKNRQEQDQLAYLMSQVDEDGSGFIDFEEFQSLCQRIDEKLKIFRFEEELEYAMSLGFSETQLRDLRWVFDTLDVDSSQKLDEHEVKSGLVMMRKHVSPDAFQAAFKSLDKDGSGEFDFLEFLMFMKMMHEGEEETAKLAPKAKNLDVRVLKRVLEYFRISKTYANSLNKHDLVALFCDYFEITPNTNLGDALHISTVAELYEAAKRQDLKLQSMGK